MSQTAENGGSLYSGKGDVEESIIPSGTYDKPHPTRLRNLTTAAILIGNVGFGSSFNFYSPTLSHLRTKYETDVDNISTVFTIMLVCYCLGALSTIPIYKYLVPRQLWVIVLLGTMAGCLFATPYLPTKTLFFVTGGFLGYAVGTYDASQVVWMIELWQEKAGPWIQAQHFCYALGTNIPGLISGAFLNTIADEEDGVTTLKPPKVDDDLHIPFIIGGVIPTVGCGCQILLFIFCRYYTPVMYGGEAATGSALQDTEKEKWNVLKYLTTTRMKLILLAGLFLGCYQGMEMTTMQFIPTFGEFSSLALTPSKAAFLLTVLTAAFAVGRFLGIFLVLKVSPVTLLVVNILLIAVGNSLLLFWGDGNLTLLWIASATLGAGFSTVYASFTSFMEKHLVFNDAVGSWMLVCGSTVAAIYPIIVGDRVEENGSILAYINYFSIVGCAVGIGLGVWVVHKSKNEDCGGQLRH